MTADDDPNTQLTQALENVTLGEREIAVRFPPVKRSHILNCSFHSWYRRYRSQTVRTRLIPLTRPFLEYLRADGIVIPYDIDSPWAGPGSSDSEPDDQKQQRFPKHVPKPDENENVTAGWEDIHTEIVVKIEELGGVVLPKLNWSAPKDATWINGTRSMDCTSPGDIYRLLKASDFVTHDLENVWDDTVDDLPPATTTTTTTTTTEPSPNPLVDTNGVPYHLVLRSPIARFNRAFEFRCFVKKRVLVGISQRHRDFHSYLFQIRGRVIETIRDFFNHRLRRTFPDRSFVFDVYLPDSHRRAWLVDINPWADRTDPLLFSWAELLTGHGLGDPDPDADIDRSEHVDTYDPFCRFVLSSDVDPSRFARVPYSAHAMPRDVVDAASDRPDTVKMADFAAEWFRHMAEQEERRRRQRQLDPYADPDSGPESDSEADGG